MKAKIFAYQKVLKIINSCTSIEQLKTAYNVIQNYKIYYNDGTFYNNLINKYKNKMFSLENNNENKFIEEINSSKEMFNLDEILNFQLSHDVQIIRGEDYQYQCIIDKKAFGSALTPIFALIVGIKLYSDNLNKNISYTEHLAKNVEENISYTEHLAKNVEENISYTEHLMKAQNFIEEKIKMLKNKYPDMSFRYGYQDFNLTHIIEVLPLSEYESNDNYINDEIDIVLEFDNNFSETILFVSENSLTKLP